MSIAFTVRCPQCGQENPADARFCMRCGISLTRRCPTCGTMNALSAQFCVRCGTALGGAAATERRVLSVLFADLVGSTALVTRIDPEPVRALIGQHFAAMRQEIERYGGVVEKFIGDAVMAVFGLPRAHEDDADRAVRAAVAIQRRMADLNATSGMGLHIRVGIATGEVVADPTAVASGQSMVTGEAVNLAFRLQAQAPSDAIVVDERTFRALRVQGEFRPLAPEPGTDFANLHRWQIVMISEGTPAKRLRAPLVGREDERQFLRVLCQRVVESRRQHVATVLGAAGVGKSRLVEEFTRQLAADGRVHILHGRCPSYGEGLTYWPLAEMIKQECGIKDNDPPGAVLEKLRAGVERVCTPAIAAQDRAAVAADLSALLGLDVVRTHETMWRDRLSARKVAAEARPASVDPVAVVTEPRRGSEVIVPSIRTFFVALAERTPLVLIIEDLHWAQESLLDLLERVVVRGPDVPILTICLARPELLERRPDWGARLLNHTTLSLAPLGADLSRSLIHELLHGEMLPADVREAVLNRAEGNPFFIEEILRRLIDGGELVRGDEGWRLAAPSVEIRIPDTIHGILASRLDLLTPAEKRVIQDASVAGRVFWLNAVVAMSALEAAEVETVLDRLAARDLIEGRDTSSLAGEREFVFKHALIKEVAYSLLPKAVRSERHLSYAQWLEQTTGRQMENLLETLAWHSEQAWRNRFDTGEMALELASRAVEALRRAGGRATHLRTMPEARTLLDRALAVMRNAGLTHDLPVYLELLIEYTEVLKWLRAPRPVVEATDTVLRDAPTIGRSDLVARAWLNRAFAQYDEGEREEAEKSLRRALEQFRDLGDRQGEVETLEMLGSVTSDLRGSLKEAEEAYRSVIELYREIGDGMGLARTTTWLGRSVLQSGRLADAREILEEGLRLSREHHERISEASALMGLAIVAHLEGRGDESERLHKDVLRLLRESGSHLDEAAVRRHLAMVYLRHGKPDDAEEQVRQAQALRREHGVKPDSSQILRTLAEISLAKGELLAAADYAERALALVRTVDRVAIASHSATLGKVRAAQGRGGDADALFQPAIEIVQANEYRIDRGLTLMKYGEALQLTGRPDDARRVLESARRVFEEIGATYFVQLCGARLGSPATVPAPG